MIAGSGDWLLAGHFQFRADALHKRRAPGRRHFCQPEVSGRRTESEAGANTQIKLDLAVIHVYC
jgi:hypothetical protein